MSLKDKLPWVKRRVYTESLRSYVDSLKKENKGLSEAVDRLRHDLDETESALQFATIEQNGAAESSQMWMKRWQDEHEKYMDLRDNLMEHIAVIEQQTDFIRAECSVDT